MTNRINRKRDWQLKRQTRNQGWNQINNFSLLFDDSRKLIFSDQSVWIYSFSFPFPTNAKFSRKNRLRAHESIAQRLINGSNSRMQFFNIVSVPLSQVIRFIILFEIQTSFRGFNKFPWKSPNTKGHKNSFWRFPRLTFHSSRFPFINTAKVLQIRCNSCFCWILLTTWWIKLCWTISEFPKILNDCWFIEKSDEWKGRCAIIKS